MPVTEPGDFPTALEPEIALSMLINDMRGLVNSTDASFQLSLIEELSQEERDKFREKVPTQLARMSLLLDNALEYLQQKYPRDGR